MSTLTFQQIHDSVHKCKLGLVALRFRDVKLSKKGKIKFGTNVPDPEELKKRQEEAKRKRRVREEEERDGGVERR